MTDEEFQETERINKIYKEDGFIGVIDYAKDKLQNYGAVKEVEKGLWVMVTGGWSDNEFWLDCLNNLISMFGMGVLFIILKNLTMILKLD